MPKLDTLPAEVRLNIYQQYHTITQLFLRLRVRVPCEHSSSKLVEGAQPQFHIEVTTQSSPRRPDDALLGACRLLRGEFMDYICGNEAVLTDVIISCGQVCTTKHAVEQLSECLSQDWVRAIRKIDISLLCHDGESALLSKSQLHVGFSRLSEVTLPWWESPLTEWIDTMTTQDEESFTRDRFEVQGHRKAVEDRCMAAFNSCLQSCHYDPHSPRPFACIQHFYIGELDVSNASGVEEDKQIAEFAIDPVMVRANTIPQKILVKLTQNKEFIIKVPANSTTIDLELKWSDDYLEAETRCLSAAPGTIVWRIF